MHRYAASLFWMYIFSAILGFHLQLDFPVVWVLGKALEGHAALITSHIPICHRCRQIRKRRLSHPTRPEPELWPGKSDLWRGHGRKWPWALLYSALLPCPLLGEAMKASMDPSLNIHLSFPFSLMWIGSSATPPIGMSWTEMPSLVLPPILPACKDTSSAGNLDCNRGIRTVIGES